MKIKNKTAKIITIGKLDILPDAVVPVSDAIMNNPIVQLFIKMKHLAVIPAAKDDEESDTPEAIAKKVKKMRKDKVCEELKALGVEFNEADELPTLKQMLIEALV